MSSRLSSGIRTQEYDSTSDSEDDMPTPSRSTFFPSPTVDYLFPPTLHSSGPGSGRSSTSSSTSSTPVPSRSTSPLPQFLVPQSANISGTDDTDSEPYSPLVTRAAWRESRQRWWPMSRRRRKRDGKMIRSVKKWMRRLVLTLIMLSVFAIFLTLLLIYILNPDKEPLPWKAYCTRRMIVRTTWAGHQRSRDGAGEGDGGLGTSRSIDMERRVKLEMELYNDIIILPMAENMNGGKTHTFFSWAAINAWFSYSNQTSVPPPIAPHDPPYARRDLAALRPKSWVLDDDSFVMLAELEARLPTPSPKIPADVPEDPLVYWGYLVTNRLHRFMAGEIYALSWSLVDWVSKDPTVKGLTRGAEDKQTAKWMKIHPRAREIVWASERCWIYDHPRAGTVYSHGYLFPSEVARVREKVMPEWNRSINNTRAAGIAAPLLLPSWATSSVSTFGVRYSPPLPDLSTSHSIEALVEGSDMSTIREGNPMTPEYAWSHREGRRKRYEGARLGGTVVVHFIKKHMWYLETAHALLEGDEMSEAEKFQRDESNSVSTPDIASPPSPVPPPRDHAGRP
ncbi:hypothetical protein BD779DRAFT_1485462 [Infundibulicybe gibba]|nr:hypothetical protein BD779DRAFT_1485462 [Infundibulicybe gibba]